MIALSYIASFAGFVFFKYREMDAAGAIMNGFIYFGLPVSGICLIASFLLGFYGY